uniref:Uncharacterized protein n=1 Tax=Anguilla anguilla TaxID=7936 RepID=A0A0E9V6T5_ANGAN
MLLISLLTVTLCLRSTGMRTLSKPAPGI